MVSVVVPQSSSVLVLASENAALNTDIVAPGLDIVVPVVSPHLALARL